MSTKCALSGADVNKININVHIRNENIRLNYNQITKMFTRKIMKQKIVLPY